MAVSINVSLFGIGESGKTSFVNSVLGKPFDPQYVMTQKTQVQAQYQMTVESKAVEGIIYDISGESLSSTIMTINQWGSNGSIHIIFIKKGDTDSTNSARYWLTDLRKLSLPGLRAVVMTHADLEGPDFTIAELNEDESTPFFAISLKDNPQSGRDVFEKILAQYMIQEGLVKQPKAGAAKTKGAKKSCIVL